MLTVKLRLSCFATYNKSILTQSSNQSTIYSSLLNLQLSKPVITFHINNFKRKTRMETKQELRLQLIKELAECIALLTDEEYTYSVDYVVNRYLSGSFCI